MLEKEVVKRGRKSAADNRAAVLKAGERKRRNRKERGQPTKEAVLAWMRTKPAPTQVVPNPRHDESRGWRPRSYFY